MMFVNIRYYLIFFLSVFVLCSSPVSLHCDHSLFQGRPSDISTDDELSGKERNPYSFPPLRHLPATFARPTTAPGVQLRKVEPASTWNPQIVLPAKNLSSWLNVLLNEFGDMISGTSSRSDRRSIDVSKAILKLEIFTMAAGDHFILPPNADRKIERPLKRNAEALGSTWLDLRFTRTIDTILNEVVHNISLTQYDLMKVSQSGFTFEKMQESLRSAVNELFNKIDQHDNPNLFERFSRHRRMSTYNGVVYFPFDDVKQKIIDEKKLTKWLKNFKIRKFLIHKQFIELGKNPVYYNLVSPIYNLAAASGIAGGGTCHPRVYELYELALDRIARSFIVDDYPQEVVRALVDKFMKNINANESLRHIYEVLKTYYREEELLAFDIL